MTPILAALALSAWLPAPVPRRAHVSMSGASNFNAEWDRVRQELEAAKDLQKRGGVASVGFEEATSIVESMECDP